MHACFAVKRFINAAWYDITSFPTLLDKFTNVEQNLFISAPKICWQSLFNIINPAQNMTRKSLCTFVLYYT